MIDIISQPEHERTFFSTSADVRCIEEGIPGEPITFGTRHDSNEAVDREKRYKQIIGILKEYRIPLSAKEIAVATHMKGYTPTDERNFAAPRLTELSQKGVVEPCGKQKCTYSGKTVTVYYLTK